MIPLGAEPQVALPPCYSPELDDCLNDKNPAYPNCAAMKQLDEATDGDVWYQIPVCACGTTSTEWIVLGVGGALALLLGFVLGKASR